MKWLSKVIERPAYDKGCIRLYVYNEWYWIDDGVWIACLSTVQGEAIRDLIQFEEKVESKEFWDTDYLEVTK